MIIDGVTTYIYFRELIFECVFFSKCVEGPLLSCYGIDIHRRILVSEYHLNCFVRLVVKHHPPITATCTKHQYEEEIHDFFIIFIAKFVLPAKDTRMGDNQQEKGLSKLDKMQGARWNRAFLRVRGYGFARRSLLPSLLFGTVCRSSSSACATVRTT